MNTTSIRKELLRWGGYMAGIYLIYVIAFPLIPYIYLDGNMLDLEMILRNGARWFIWVYILGLIILFYSFWRVTKLMHEFSKQNKDQAASMRKLILSIGITCGIILLFLYPITAIDVAVYVVNARNWVLNGGNPLTVPPETFPDDPYIHLAGEYVNKTSPYGPVWEIIGSIPIRIGITEIAGGIIAMKIISLLAYIFMAWLIGWHSKQQDEKHAVSQVTVLTFFALNPLVMLEALGNGHNDMLMIAFIMLGLILWQKNYWIWATVALTLAALVKLPALIFIPLFGLASLTATDSWRTRLIRTFGMGLIFLSLFFSLYRLMGPFPDVFNGILESFARRSFSPAYALHVVVREFSPELAPTILANTRNLFLLIYSFIAIQFIRKKLTLLEAGFLVYLVQIILVNAFRFWYPLWLLPFAVLNLHSRTYWRTFLFSVAVEFSILSYYILWRWHMRYWEISALAPYWNYFTIMTPLTAAWSFTLPFLGDLVGWVKDKARYKDTLWI